MKHFLFLLLFPLICFSQTSQDKKNIISKTNVTVLKRISEESARKFKENKTQALAFAKSRNWSRTIFKDSVFSELIGITPDLKPIYNSTFNKGAGITSRANRLHSGGSLGLSINGENMTAGVWDAGSGMPSHQLFSNRLEVMDNAPSSHYHSAHVAGTIIGSDLFQNGNAKGMAFKGNVKSYDWNSDVSEIATAAANGLLVSNHSYGRNPFGLNINEWGKYDTQAQSLDEIMFNAPYYQFVCAAGNSRVYGVNTGKNGFDLLSGHATSKNGITVAAVEEVLNYTGAASVPMSEFSSWGPTDDGRIKPDISAKGVDTFSALDSSISSYGLLSGTSMASPSVAGTLLLYQQYYKQLNNSFMKASTLRGLMIHTADEAGADPGPDYKFGWGLINAEKAADVIKKNQTESFILENNLNSGDTYTLSVNSLGTEPLIATLCWTDPKGNIPGNSTDDPTALLVNNLDLKLSQNSTVHYPWKLDRNNLNNAATKGENDVDNVEKVNIDNPLGSYLITINHKGVLQGGAQNYSLIISGVTANDFWTVPTANDLAVCEGSSSVTYDFALRTKSNFNETVSFSAVNLPSNVIAAFNPTSLNAAGSFSMTLSNISTLPQGVYHIIVRSQTATTTFENELTLNIYSNNLISPTLISPENNSISIAIPTVFNWQADLNAQSYDIQIASDISFTNMVVEQNVSQNQFTTSVLNHNQIYFWRVRSKNICGIGAYSNPFQLSTSCVLPSNISLVSSTTNQAQISWENTGNNSSFEIEMVPLGTNPTGSGTILTTTSTTFTGLNHNSCYQFYIRSVCSNGTSVWSNPFQFCTQPDYCGGDHFYDTGGPDGDYQNNEYYVKTIEPDVPGHRVKAIFNSFNVENSWDFLTIYNGPDINSPILYSATGTNIPVVLASTHPSGKLTFRFFSDNIYTESGWDASIVCEALPTCSDTPFDINVLGTTYNTASFSWNQLTSSNSWEVEIVPHGTTPTGTGTNINSNPYIAPNLNSNTVYDFYVRKLCDNGFSDWSIPVSFQTKANFCGGDHFTDTGGINGNYPYYEYKVTTIEPNNSGDRVRLNFNSFDLGTATYFVVYNGTSTSDPILFNSNGANSPGTLTATNLAGTLTVEFYVNTNVTASGWDATVTCEPLPPCAQAPSYVYLNNATTNTANFNWQENSGANSWQIEIVPHNNPPTGVGVITTSKPYTRTGLTSNTWYDLYVRSQCSNGNSDWTGPFVFNTQANYCSGDHFYDSGGPNDNYRTNESYSKTIYPVNSGDRIRAVFNSYNIGSSSFYVYNSQNTNSSNLIYSSDTANGVAPTTLLATNPSGALTFVFVSNNANTNSGWDASIFCEPLPACSNAPSNIYSYSISTTSASFNWTENSNVTSWEIEIVPQGTTPTGVGFITSSRPYTKTGLTSNTWYEFYIRSRCGNTNSVWAGPFKFNTLPNYCSGDHFYDSGGPNGNYTLYEYTNFLITPTGTGNRVRADFNSFNLSTSDYFTIYNGTNSSAPILFTRNSNNQAIPTSVAATGVSGSLYVSFSSYNQVNSGWDATITCEPIPPCSNAPSSIILATKTTNSATFNWTENSSATSWEVEVVQQGTPPTGTGNLALARPYTKVGLISNTWYEFYVRSKCGSVNSTWTGPFLFNTNPLYCAGDHFYDSGGPNGNYTQYEYSNFLISPTGTGNRVRADFNSFNLNTNDNFTVYNGPNSSYPVIYTRNSSNLASPTSLVATSLYGSLYVTFSGSYQTNSGWDATITCEPLPPCSEPPSNASATNTTTNSTSINWTENSGATSWEIEFVNQGAPPTGVGTLITTKPYNKTGLTSNTWYEYYMRAKCGNSYSTWAGPFKFNTLANYCLGDHFYDSGGPNGNYSANEYKNYLINPTGTGNRVRLNFNSFNVNTYDNFTVYNGPNSSYPVLFTRNSSNPTTPTNITATNLYGSLYVVFSSSSQSNSGWDATVTCEPLPPCAQPPSNANFYGISTTNVTVNWFENSNANTWEIEFVAQGTPPTGSGTTITTNPYTKTGLTSNTWYDVYLRSKCGNTNSTWAGPFKFNTLPNYCSGDHFFDSGGPNGNYQPYEYYSATISPTGTGNRVRLDFNSFHLNINDNFIIYDGPNSSYPAIFTKNSGSQTTPTSYTANNISGTFYVTFSASSLINTGWDATVTCEPMPPCALMPTNLSTAQITNTSAQISWTENLSATTWEYEIVPNGSNPTGIGISITSNPFTVTGLNSDSCYTFYLRSSCTNNFSPWNSTTFCTTPNYCVDGHFYDSGGLLFEYNDNENYTTTIYPSTPGHAVQVVFTSFSLESCCDYLKIYNGPNTSSTLMFNSGSASPGVKTSTHPTGALTFVFHSDSSVTYPGWEATVDCDAALGDNDFEERNIEYYPNPTDNILHIKSPFRIEKYQLFDLNMRLILDQFAHSDQFNINLTEYSSGAYFVKLFDSDNQQTQIKVLKK